MRMRAGRRDGRVGVLAGFWHPHIAPASWMGGLVSPWKDKDRSISGSGAYRIDLVLLVSHTSRG